MSGDGGLGRISSFRPSSGRGGRKESTPPNAASPTGDGPLRRTSSTASGGANAFQYPGELGELQLAECKQFLSCGAAGAGGADSDGVWLEDYITACRDYSQVRRAGLRDWNADFQQLVEWAESVSDGGTQSDRADRIADLVDDFKQEMTANVEKVVRSAHGASVEGLDVVRALRRGTNGLPVASYSAGSVFFHISAEPRLPSRVQRNCAAVGSVRVPNLFAPLCVQFVCAGHRVLAAAKIPLVRGAVKAGAAGADGSPHSASLLASLRDGLGVSALDLGVADIWYGSDSRMYLVPGCRLLPAADAGGGGPKDSITIGLAADNLGEPLSESTAPARRQAILEAFCTSAAAGKVPCGGDCMQLMTELRSRGLGAWALPKILLNEKLSGSEQPCKDMRGLCVVEMAARTLRHVLVAEISRLADCPDIMAEARARTARLFHHALIDRQMWGEVIGPLVAEKFKVPSSELAYGKHYDRGHRQTLLRRLCEFLGCSTSQQQVADFIPVIPTEVEMHREAAHERLERRGAKGAEAEKKLRAAIEEAKENFPEREKFCVMQLAEYFESTVENIEDVEQRAASGAAKKVDELYTELIDAAREAANSAAGAKQAEKKYALSAVLEHVACWHLSLERYDECIELFDEAIEARSQATSNSPKDSVDMTRLLFKKVEAQVRSTPEDERYGDFDEMKPGLVNILTLLDGAVEKGLLDPRVAYSVFAPVLEHLIKGCLANEDNEGAEPYALRMANMCTEAKGPRSEDVAMAETEVGNVYMALQKFDDAGEHFQRAVDIYTEVHGTQHPTTATAMNNLACLYYNQATKANKGVKQNILRPKMTPVAKDYFARAKAILDTVVMLPKEVLDLIEDEEGDEAGTAGGSLLADALNNLASVNLLMGDYKQAEHLYERSLDLSLTLFHDGHADVQNARKNLQIMRNRRRLKSALHLQVVFRGFRARKRIRLIKQASVLLTIISGALSGKLAAERKEEENARQIQELVGQETAARQIVLDLEYEAWLELMMSFGEGARGAQRAERDQLERLETAARKVILDEEIELWLEFIALAQAGMGDAQRRAADAAALRKLEQEEEEARRLIWFEGIDYLALLEAEAEEERRRAEAMAEEEAGRRELEAMMRAGREGIEQTRKAVGELEEQETAGRKAIQDEEQAAWGGLAAAAEAERADVQRFLDAARQLNTDAEAAMAATAAEEAQEWEKMMADFAAGRAAAEGDAARREWEEAQRAQFEKDVAQLVADAEKAAGDCAEEEAAERARIETAFAEARQEAAARALQRGLRGLGARRELGQRRAFAQAADQVFARRRGELEAEEEKARAAVVAEEEEARAALAADLAALLDAKAKWDKEQEEAHRKAVEVLEGDEGQGRAAIAAEEQAAWDELMAQFNWGKNQQEAFETGAAELLAAAESGRGEIEAEEDAERAKIRAQFEEEGAGAAGAESQRKAAELLAEAEKAMADTAAEEAAAWEELQKQMEASRKEAAEAASKREQAEVLAALDEAKRKWEEEQREKFMAELLAMADDAEGTADEVREEEDKEREILAQKAREEMESLQSGAAKKIQAIQRGRSGRRLADERRRSLSEEAAKEQSLADQQAKFMAELAKMADFAEEALMEIEEEEAAERAALTKQRDQERRRIEAAERAAEAGAATRIQAIQRGRSARKEANERREEQERRAAAATRIQNARRASKARMDLVARKTERQEQAHAAEKIQSMQRARAARKEFNERLAEQKAKVESHRRRQEEEERAATQLQRVTRGRDGRKKAGQRKAEIKSATAIQAAERGRRARRQSQDLRRQMAEQQAKEQAAATRMQSVARGRAGRRKSAVLRDEMQEEQRERERLAAQQEEKRKAEAAVQIQAMQRGRQGRRASTRAKEELEAQKQRDAATKIQAIQRGREGRRRSINLRAAREEEERRRKEEELAATKIQSIQRGQLARRKSKAVRQELEEEKERKKNNAAATNIQRSWRGKQGREEADKARAERKVRAAAATVIQAAWRGKKGRDRARRRREERQRAIDEERLYWENEAKQHAEQEVEKREGRDVTARETAAADAVRRKEAAEQQEADAARKAGGADAEGGTGAAGEGGSPAGEGQGAAEAPGGGAAGPAAGGAESGSPTSAAAGEQQSKSPPAGVAKRGGAAAGKAGGRGGRSAAPSKDAPASQQVVEVTVASAALSGEAAAALSAGGTRVAVALWPAGGGGGGEGGGRSKGEGSGAAGAGRGARGAKVGGSQGRGAGGGNGGGQKTGGRGAADGQRGGGARGGDRRAVDADRAGAGAGRSPTPQEIARRVALALDKSAPDADSVFDALDKVENQKVWDAVTEAFKIEGAKLRDGDLVDSLDDKLSGAEVQKCESILLKKNVDLRAGGADPEKAKALADKLAKALEPPAADAAAVLEVLGDVEGQKMWDAVTRAFESEGKKVGDGDLECALDDKLSGAEVQQCDDVLLNKGVRLRNGDPKRKGKGIAKRLVIALEQPDTEAVLEALGGVRDQQTWDAVAEAFQSEGAQLSDGNLAKCMESQLGEGDLARCKSALEANGVAFDPADGAGAGQGAAPAPAAGGAADQADGDAAEGGAGTGAGADKAKELARELVKVLGQPGADAAAVCDVLGGVEDQQMWDSITEAFLSDGEALCDGDLVRALDDKLSGEEVRRCEDVLLEKKVRLRAGGRGKAKDIAKRLVIALEPPAADAAAVLGALGEVEDQKEWDGVVEEFRTEGAELSGGDLVGALENKLSGAEVQQCEDTLLKKKVRLRAPARGKAKDLAKRLVIALEPPAADAAAVIGALGEVENQAEWDCIVSDFESVGAELSGGDLVGALDGKLSGAEVQQCEDTLLKKKVRLRVPRGGDPPSKSTALSAGVEPVWGDNFAFDVAVPKSCRVAFSVVGADGQAAGEAVLPLSEVVRMANGCYDAIDQLPPLDLGPGVALKVRVALKSPAPGPARDAGGARGRGGDPGKGRGKGRPGGASPGKAAAEGAGAEAADPERAARERAHQLQLAEDDDRLEVEIAEATERHRLALAWRERVLAADARSRERERETDQEEAARDFLAGEEEDARRRLRVAELGARVGDDRVRGWEHAREQMGRRYDRARRDIARQEQAERADLYAARRAGIALRRKKEEHEEWRRNWDRRCDHELHGTANAHQAAARQDLYRLGREQQALWRAERRRSEREEIQRRAAAVRQEVDAALSEGRQRRELDKEWKHGAAREWLRTKRDARGAREEEQRRTAAERLEERRTQKDAARDAIRRQKEETMEAVRSRATATRSGTPPGPSPRPRPANALTPIPPRPRQQQQQSRGGPSPVRRGNPLAAVTAWGTPQPPRSSPLAPPDEPRWTGEVAAAVRRREQEEDVHAQMRASRDSTDDGRNGLPSHRPLPPLHRDEETAALVAFYQTPDGDTGAGQPATEGAPRQSGDGGQPLGISDGHEEAGAAVAHEGGHDAGGDGEGGADGEGAGGGGGDHGEGEGGDGGSPGTAELDTGTADPGGLPPEGGGGEGRDSGGGAAEDAPTDEGAGSAGRGGSGGAAAAGPDGRDGRERDRGDDGGPRGSRDHSPLRVGGAHGDGEESPLGAGGARARPKGRGGEVARAGAPGRNQILQWNREASRLAHEGDHQGAASYLRKANFGTLEGAEPRLGLDGLVFASRDERLRLRAVTLNNVGCLYKRLRNFPKALEYLNVVRSIERALFEESPSTLLNLSAVHAGLHDAVPALDYARRAMTLQRARLAVARTPRDVAGARHLILIAFHNLAAAQAISPSEGIAAKATFAHALRMAHNSLPPGHPTIEAVTAAAQEFERKKVTQLQPALSQPAMKGRRPPGSQQGGRQPVGVQHARSAGSLRQARRAR
eukprot:TRINITY_DN1790_c1_g4_i3.p1 TRINITY_DN1790_c1_g4~~TRINITY_DN1790_c1_g4_i3.p1  ORF type:complete len:3846 (+),score=1138.78 TRINITY_DN1790_c1_g4_i3:75-11612(+)